jgi:hypothetical protein
MLYPFPELIQTSPRNRAIQRLRATRLIEFALAKQSPELSIVKREKWTETDLDGLPIEEPELFDRKAGQLFEDQENFSIRWRRQFPLLQTLAADH